MLDIESLSEADKTKLNLLQNIVYSPSADVPLLLANDACTHITVYMY